MSIFLREKFHALEPYTPGEQPREAGLCKLNTNESPFPPPPSVVEAASHEAGRLQLYCDPDCTELREALAALLGNGLTPNCLVMTNGSDEALDLAFAAFADHLAFPDVTYGFYPVLANLLGIPCEEIPLRDDFTVDLTAFTRLPRGVTVVLANPNAPTGIALPRSEIEQLLRDDPARLVIVDEAYVDFGGESCLPLVREYPNLLVTQTFSKSRSLAGGRLGFAAADPALIADLNRLRNAKNPYNVNRMTQAAGIAAIAAQDIFSENCRTIAVTRERTARALAARGFEVLPSRANFLFARHPDFAGKYLLAQLRERGILVRHFDKPRTRDFLRVTIGSDAQMTRFLAVLDEILEGEGKGTGAPG